MFSQKKIEKRDTLFQATANCSLTQLDLNDGQMFCSFNFLVKIMQPVLAEYYAEKILTSLSWSSPENCAFNTIATNM